MRSIIALVIILLVGCTPTNKKTSQADAPFNEFIASFIAPEDEDAGTVDDLSLSGMTQQLQQKMDKLAKLQSIDVTQLQPDDQVDYAFAQSILQGQILRHEQIQNWRKDPRIYMAFTQISSILSRPGDISSKVGEVEDRLKLVPAQLENGKAQLDTYVPRFQELALFMAENSQSLFDTELPEFIAGAEQNHDTLTVLNNNAKASLKKFIRFLTEELPRRGPGTFSIGEPAYNAMLREQFLLGYDGDSLWRFGWEKFNQTIHELEKVAQTIDPTKTWQQLAVEIKNEYPDPHKMIQAHQEWVDKAGEHIKSKHLIPIPWKERVEVVARAPYLRKTSYYGNFSSAKEKDEDSTYTSHWLINPYEDQWDQQRKQEYLVEHDWGVIIVTAPHETYGGHHVQGLYQLHNPRPLRKNFGLSLFSEGWGLYNEQLMQETGFFPNERIHLRQLQLRLWRNARVIYDAGLHTGRMTYEEAIQLMTDKVGFLRWAAQLEVDAACASPGYFIGYFVGMSEILAMREAYHEKMGDQFTLSDFHERLLSIGNMPPSLMRKCLLR